jgi:pimeloyl-ACP methyl ester carboxylesterase
MPDLDSILPASLRAISSTVRLGPDVPSLIVRPEGDPLGGPARKAPFLIWMHGRTATKELDPGRYLRLARAGIGSCAIDLPGHGERRTDEGQRPEHILDHIEQAIDELDDVILGLSNHGFDLDRMAIGGMSMGGMVAIARLCRPHRFRAAIFEASSGNWKAQHQRQFFDHEATARLDPLTHLDSWREIPVLAVHSRLDEWVRHEGQAAFLDALRLRAEDPSIIESLDFDETGAPHEHLGFGRCSNVARTREIEFLTRWLA